MARNANLNLTAQTWTEVSDAENIAGTVKVQNIGGHDVWLRATPNSTAPTGAPAGDTLLRPGLGERGTLADLFPGISSPVRLWAYAANGGALSVQYA